MTLINQLNPCTTQYSAEYFEPEKFSSLYDFKPSQNILEPVVSITSRYNLSKPVMLPNSLQSITNINKTSNMNQTIV